MYPYTQHLLQLEQCWGEVAVAAQLKRAQSLLMASQWWSFTQHHPDKQFSTYVLTGLTQGPVQNWHWACRAECCPALSSVVQPGLSRQQPGGGYKVLGRGSDTGPHYWASATRADTWGQYQPSGSHSSAMEMAPNSGPFDPSWKKC